MRVFAAYLGVILIWSTTPLAIKWSGEGPGFLFGVTARMLIGLCCVGFILALRRQPLPRNRKACLGYLAAAVHIYGAMLAVYWASQFIPSGWIAVVFGLTPMLTALMAALWLGERSLTLGKWLAYVLGMAGLVVMYGSALDLSPLAIFGVSGVLVSAFLQAASSVWLKWLNSGLPALTLVGGGLMVAVPAYLLTWVIFDGCWPIQLSTNSVLSIAYLGVIATPFGFAMYFFVLKHLAATQVALITLITPIMAVFIGHVINHEPISPHLLLGAGLILIAVVTHELKIQSLMRFLCA